MRVWINYLLVTTLLAVGIIGAWGGPCVPTGRCDKEHCDVVWVEKAKCCVFDHGCWLNPSTPDNQIWCEEYVIYKCRTPSGRFYACQETHDAYECGPCCESAGWTPVAPVPTP